MKYVSVIGNGESRRGFDLYQLQWLGTTVGTNAAHREFHPDHLVCCDRRMVQEAVNTGYENPVYTRNDWYKQFSFWRNVTCVPDLPYTGDKRQDDPWHWGSGGHALNLACTMNPEYVVIIGFDLWGVNDKVNNIYKDTEHYSSADKHAVDPSYWVYQTAKLFEHYPDIKFIQIQPDSWEPPESWEQYDNFYIDDYAALNNLISANK